MRAVLRHTRLSPKKANLVASMVRNMSVSDALSTLERLPKKGASILHGVISSAASNAENNAKQQRDALFIKEIIVNKGHAFRRFLPIARGRTRPIKKWTSHILVELGVIVPPSSAPSGASADKEGEKPPTPKETKKVAKKRKEDQPSPASGGLRPAGKQDDNVERVEKVDLRHGGASESTFDAPEDSQSKGSQKDGGGSTFQHQRKGSRGS